MTKQTKKIEWKTEIFLLVILFGLGFFFLPTTGPFCRHSVMSMTSDYFNYAKSMIHGKKLYVDLFDHKGLFLFLMYYPAYWISATSYLGVFMMEGIVSGCILCLGYRYLRIRCSKWKSFIVSFLFGATLYLLFPMSMYNSECIAMICLLILLAYVETGRYSSYGAWYYFGFGIMFSVLFWTKYPLITLMFPFFLYLLIKSIQAKRIADFVKSCCYSLSAFIVFSGFMLWYFIRNDSLEIMIQSYFMGVHPKITPFSGSLIEIVCFMIIIGTILFLITNKDILNVGFKLYISVWLSVLMIALNICGGMRTYSVCFISLLLLLTLPEFTEKGLAVYCLGMILLGLPVCFTGYHPSDNSIADFANKYHITNANILYLDGDLGFGCYSDYPYRSKFQWIPDRVSFDDNEEMYETICDYLKNQTFEYMIIAKKNFHYDESFVTENKNQMISNLAVENYDIVDSFQFCETYISEFYICKKKNWQ